ncbi:olfactory receptor 2A12-like [Salvelinus alpinus]|uniref:olfactory receptor 2A12-like n=1 Tax=Salvelinus alpinus TaxID=8036 RepID=UPI0039FCDFF3
MAHEQSVLVTSNATFVRPSYFYINGFEDIPHIKYYYVFLGLVYAVTVLANSFIMAVIYLARNLHTAKYVVVFNLAVTDLCGSTALIPKLIETFLFEKQYISYEACLSSMFCVYVFMTMQSLSLLTLAYDRFVAIVFPLRYHVIVTRTSMAVILVVLWLFTLALISFTVSLITRLSFCGSLAIKSFFCDHGPTYTLSCNDNSLNNIMAWVCFLVVMCIPIILIVLTYICIAIALIRIATGEERVKAMRTCTSHLILVAIFYLPMVGNNIAAVVSYIHPNARIINNSLTQTLPSMLNPIIYSLRTEEVLDSVRKLYNIYSLRTEEVLDSVRKLYKRNKGN